MVTVPVGIPTAPPSPTCCRADRVARGGVTPLWPLPCITLGIVGAAVVIATAEQSIESDPAHNPVPTNEALNEIVSGWVGVATSPVTSTPPLAYETPVVATGDPVHVAL